MNMTGDNEKLKQWIDNASPEQLLRRWRFGASTDPITQGEVGEYFSKAFAKMQRELGSKFPALSKKVGWTNANI